MWFKQLSIYPITQGKTPDQDKLINALKAVVFSPCQGLDWFSEGFTYPVDTRPDELAFAVQGSIKVALRKEEKVLPSSVINEVLADKIVQIEQEDSRTVGRKEKQALKEQITDDLLPRAFTKSTRTEAIFDTKRDYLLINQASAPKAESMLTKLRQSLGGLEAKLPRTELSTATVMTKWLAQKSAEGNFVLDSDCELNGAGEVAAIVRMSKQDLTADEITAHLENKIVSQIGLIWADKIRFVLTSDLTFKRIQFLDVLQEEASNEGEDKESLLSASQMIMTEALGQMVEELFKHLGGLEN